MLVRMVLLQLYKPLVEDDQGAAPCSAVALEKLHGYDTVLRFESTKECRINWTDRSYGLVNLNIIDKTK